MVMELSNGSDMTTKVNVVKSVKRDCHCQRCGGVSAAGRVEMVFNKSSI